MNWDQATDLLAVCDVLEIDVAEVERKQGKRKFDMDQWFEPGDTAAPAPSLDPDFCGTQGCFCGWAAAVLPGGLTLRADLNFGGQYNLFFGSLGGFEAAAERFGITKDTAERLFAPGSYDEKGIESVVLRVREFVARQWDDEAGLE